MTLTFTKVWETSRKTFYKLSSPITKGVNPLFDWETEKFDFRRTLKPKYVHFLTKEIEYVCISDAHTHIERLVFPAMRTDKNYEALIGDHMAGELTFMHEGGDIDSIQEHTHYLGELADANGFSSYKIMELLEINRD